MGIGKRPPQIISIFTYSEKLKWKSVDTPWVRKAANECSTGSDWSGSSKDLIYRYFHDSSGNRGRDVERFRRVMDALAEEIPKIKTETHKKLSTLIGDTK